MSSLSSSEGEGEEGSWESESDGVEEEEVAWKKQAKMHIVNNKVVK
jgi:hypothetical protein